MKNVLSCLAIIICMAFSLTAQTEFEAGYFINTDGSRTECLIKNLQWRENPSSIKYKTNENADVQTISMDQMSEFGIDGNKSKFKKFKVEMDRSTDNANILSTNRVAEFKEETLMLNVLMEGKASLYRYTERSLDRFFYTVDDSKITQLVYKRYKTEDQKIGKNYQFRQQITNDLKCGNSINTANLSYAKSQLVSVFKLYNKCEDAEIISFDKRDRKDAFMLTLKPGVNLRSMSLKNIYSSARNIDFGVKASFRIGMAAEFVFNFNNGKWSFLFEPTYQSFNASVNSSPTIKYNSLELPVGLRHYIYLNDDAKIFANMLLTYDVSFNSTVDYQSAPDLKSEFNAWNAALGAGFMYKKFSAEIRYDSRRDILLDYANWSSNYSGFSVILGYRLK